MAEGETTKMTSAKEAYEMRLAREMIQRDPQSKPERVAEFILSVADASRTLRKLVLLRRQDTESKGLDDAIAYLTRTIEHLFKKTFGVEMFPETQSDAESN